MDTSEQESQSMRLRQALDILASEEYSYEDWVTPKEDESEMSVPNPKPFECDCCKRIFANEILLHQHWNEASYVRWHCGRCSYTFCSEQPLLDHDCPYWNQSKSREILNLPLVVIRLSYESKTFLGKLI